MSQAFGAAGLPHVRLAAYLTTGRLSDPPAAQLAMR